MARSRRKVVEWRKARAVEIDNEEAPPSKSSKKRTRAALRDDRDENEHESDIDEAPPPKRSRKENKSISGAVPNDNETAPGFLSKSKVRRRKVASQSHVVDEETDRADEDVKAKKGKQTFALNLFYGETGSKQRHARRILCIRSAVGPNHVIVPKESKSRYHSGFVDSMLLKLHNTPGYGWRRVCTEIVSDKLRANTKYQIASSVSPAIFDRADKFKVQGLSKGKAVITHCDILK